MGEAAALTVRPLDEHTRAWANTLLTEQWGSTRVVTRGRLVDAAHLPGFVALRGEEQVGVVTYEIHGPACEVVTLNSVVERIGAGGALLRAVHAAARAAGCERVWLITTNDNLPALRFYQRQGYHLVAVHPDALTASRRLKPEIPLIGLDGIPLRDELELVLFLE